MFIGAHPDDEAFTLATRVVALERTRDRPAERMRSGATITRDISIWPPRLRVSRLEAPRPTENESKN